MISLEKIEDSFELPIGTRFYFMGHIYEVVKSDDGRSGCPKCALFDDLFNNHMYQVCDLQRNERRDEKLIFLEKELNKIRRNNNG